MKYSFNQRYTGEWEVVRHKMNVCCCDCGLGHIYRFRARKGTLEWAVWRNPAITRQSRARKKHKFTRRK